MPPKKRPAKSTHLPSDGEICGKVALAISALEAGESHIELIHKKHNQLAFDFLGVTKVEEVYGWALTFLHEIREMGPVSCFIHHGKAERCTENHFTDLFLFPYVFKSSHFEDEVYLKFGIRRSKLVTDPPHFYCHLDLHKSTDA